MLKIYLSKPIMPRATSLYRSSTLSKKTAFKNTNIHYRKISISSMGLRKYTSRTATYLSRSRGGARLGRRVRRRGRAAVGARRRCLAFGVRGPRGSACPGGAAFFRPRFTRGRLARPRVSPCRRGVFACPPVPAPSAPASPPLPCLGSSRRAAPRALPRPRAGAGAPPLVPLYHLAPRAPRARATAGPDGPPHRSGHRVRPTHSRHRL